MRSSTFFLVSQYLFYVTELLVCLVLFGLTLKLQYFSKFQLLMASLVNWLHENDKNQQNWRSKHTVFIFLTRKRANESQSSHIMYANWHFMLEIILTKKNEACCFKAFTKLFSMAIIWPKSLTTQWQNHIACLILLSRCVRSYILQVQLNSIEDAIIDFCELKSKLGKIIKMENTK